MRALFSSFSDWIAEEVRLATLPSWDHEPRPAAASRPKREWALTQAVRRWLLRIQIRRDTARLDKLHRLMVEERAMVEAVYRREIELVECAISEASASLARLSAEALVRRAVARANP